MAKNAGNQTSGPRKSRRASVLRNMPKETFSLLGMLRNPEFTRTCAIIFVFLIVVSILATWSREQIKVHDGQIASVTRITRLDFQVEDVVATEAKREEARNSSPRSYVLNSSFIERLEAP